MDNKELLKLCEEQIGSEYFELLQVASLIQILSSELNNEEVCNKVYELIDFIKKEAEKLLEVKS